MQHKIKVKSFFVHVDEQKKTIKRTDFSEFYWNQCSLGLIEQQSPWHFHSKFWHFRTFTNFFLYTIFVNVSGSMIYLRNGNSLWSERWGRTALPSSILNAPNNNCHNFHRMWSLYNTQSYTAIQASVEHCIRPMSHRYDGYPIYVYPFEIELMPSLCELKMLTTKLSAKTFFQCYYSCWDNIKATRIKNTEQEQIDRTCWNPKQNGNKLRDQRSV